jgi:pyrroloquinoline quinone (PQQ) biosynthesis protein C
MSDAQKLFAEIKKEMADLEDRIRHHPFIAGVEAGEAPREALTIFAGEQYHIIESDLRSVAQLISRHPSPLTHEFFWGTLQGEKAALDHILAFGRALGVDREDLSAREPAPEAHAYPAYMAWLGVYGSAGQAAAAFALNFDAWGANCGKMEAGLREHYGLSAGDLAFFELFSNPPADLAERAAEIVDQDLARGVPPKRIKQSARLLQGYELMFWDYMEWSR